MDEVPPITASLEPDPPARGLITLISKWSAGQPILAIALVSFLAVCVNCYPILFCGKSYVSPASVESLVYGSWPPLPGMEATHQAWQHGSDTGAIMWWGVPVGFVESRSLLERGELPLWNRYSHGGDTLVGQAISMLGDPLQWLVIMGRGSAGAWDVKFLAAKFIFCIGFGWLILRLLGSLPLALVYTALAAFCGAFFSINNHPVFFVFAYAPWILLSALMWLDGWSERHVRWGLVWLLVNFACFNAGHVEPAVVLIGGLNLVAVVCVSSACRNFFEVAIMLVRLAVGTLFFFGLTAPMWMSFLVALQGSYSTHSNVQILQLPLACWPGVFDDLFYLVRLPGRFVVLVPGTSMLVLAGCCFSVLGWRRHNPKPFFWVNSGAILLWGGCIFGWVPAVLLASVPFLNRIGHTYTDFSYLLVIHLTIQSAYGFKWLAQEVNPRRILAAFALLAGVFVAINLSLPDPLQSTERNYFWFVEIGAMGAPLLFIFLKSRCYQISTIGWVGIVLLGFIPNYRFGLYNVGNEYLLMVPGARAVLNARSEAVDKIQLDKAGPFRVVGLEWNFCGDYAAVYGLEDIRSCAPLSNSKFIELVQKFPGIHFASAWAFEVTNLVQAQPLLALLNVKYLLAQPRFGLQEVAGFHLVENSDFKVFENQAAWPRAFFSDQVHAISANEEFIQYLVEHKDQPFVALTKEEIARLPELQKLEETTRPTVLGATHYQLLPNSTAFDVHATAAGMVCLTEGQAKDFTATANGVTKEVLTVNRAFKGIYLDTAGDYHIKFTYRPRHWRLAFYLFWISLGTVVIVAGVSLVNFRKQTWRPAVS